MMMMRIVYMHKCYTGAVYAGVQNATVILGNLSCLRKSFTVSGKFLVVILAAFSSCVSVLMPFFEKGTCFITLKVLP